jgi:catechol 2,3-dioxygenase-like lactoylglutathione lyase family enzyme
MGFTRIHHVGMVTGDLEQACRILCDGFGLSVDEHRSPCPQGRPGYDGTTVLEFPIGEMYYEVAMPNDATTSPGEFLANTNGRGGIYYISLASDDLANDVQGLVQRGIKIVEPWDGKSAVFLDPTTCLGLGLQITPEENYYVHPYYKGNGSLTGMAHIGIAARDAEEIGQFLGQVIGLEEDRSSERGREIPRNDTPRPADDPVRLLEFPIGGTVIEISIPTTSDSGTARLVAQRATLGATYHHTCPFAPDVHRFTDEAVAAGIQQIGTIPPREESTRVVAWFHPRTCLGMLLEIWNRPPGNQHIHRHPPH